MKGGVADGVEDLDLVRQHLDLAARRSAFTVPSGRRRTLPVTCSTNSLRTRSAVAKVSARSGSQTTCARPSRSRRSMKITPPWSRRRCAQPQRVTVWPRKRVSVSRSIRFASSPATGVRSVAAPLRRGGVVPAFSAAARRLGHAHGDDVLQRLVDRHVELDGLGARHDEEEAAGGVGRGRARTPRRVAARCRRRRAGRAGEEGDGPDARVRPAHQQRLAERLAARTRTACRRSA